MNKIWDICYDNLNHWFECKLELKLNLFTFKPNVKYQLYELRN